MSNPLDPPETRGSLGTTFKRILRSLILPSNAGPNDGAIILDPNPPGCLSARYDAVIVWRAPSPSFRGQFYLGVVKVGFLPSGTVSVIERGFMLNDPDTGTCWIQVIGEWRSDFDPILGNTFSEGAGNLLTVLGPAPSADFRHLMTGFIDWNGCTSVNKREGTSFTITNGAYDHASGPVCGVAFTCPPNGRVDIQHGARLSNNGAGNSTMVTPVIRTGGTVGSGTVVFGAGDDNAVIATGPANNNMRMGVALLVTLTPGDLYNVCLEHHVTATTGTIKDRYVNVLPVF